VGSTTSNERRRWQRLINQGLQIICACERLDCPHHRGRCQVVITKDTPWDLGHNDWDRSLPSKPSAAAAIGQPVVALAQGPLLKPLQQHSRPATSSTSHTTISSLMWMWPEARMVDLLNGTRFLEKWVPGPSGVGPPGGPLTCQKLSAYRTCIARRAKAKALLTGLLPSQKRFTKGGRYWI